ncbi:DTW domain containing 2 [Cricetulus griseus]
MELEEEARTLAESRLRPSGASGSPTPDEEERPEGSTALVAPPAGFEGDSAGADGLWGLPVEHAERRPECSRCSPTSSRIAESKVLRTVPLLAACLPPDKCTVKIGRRFSEER